MPIRPVLSRLTWIRGAIPVAPGGAEAALLVYLLADLIRRGCPARLDQGVLIVDGPSSGRWSVLATVDGGRLWLAGEEPRRMLHYAFSTRGVLALCVGISVVAGGLAWYALDSNGLAAFWFLAPVLWLYGANRVVTGLRIPGWLGRLCRTAPGHLSGPG